MTNYWRSALPLVALYALAAGSQAATVASFSPQGEVTQISQVRAQFSEPMIAFGDPKIKDPFTVQCKARGNGRWINEKNWVYEFTEPLSSGLNCQFKLIAGLNALSGSPVQGQSTFTFTTGGPFVSRIQPYASAQIDEDQAFVLQHSAPVAESVLREKVYCERKGVEERIPVKLVSGKDRKAILDNLQIKVTDDRVSVIQCQQTFPNAAEVRVVWEKGIVSTEGGPANSKAQSFRYKVRPAFTAEMNCTRENARAACTPILPLTLTFNTPVKRELIEKITLKTPKATLKPVLSADDKKAQTLSYVSFPAPYTENAELSLELPSSFTDESGRKLENASAFPMKIRTADFPPLAKFATAPFGIVEWTPDAAMPLTLRQVELDIGVKQTDGKKPAGQLTQLRATEDAAIIGWIAQLNKYHESILRIGKEDVQSRTLSLLSQQKGTEKISLPSAANDNKRPFEVVGIPMRKPGFYVFEVESRLLGKALLDRDAPMYVRTSALTTNLAVHLKTGRENSLVWVTRLDNGKPVPGAEIRISDCHGKQIWNGKTGAQGTVLANVTSDQACPSVQGAEAKIQGLFASARLTDANGVEDMSFVLSSWNQGIESFRFNFPTDFSPVNTKRAHTIFDRPLFRAGQTVSMKHVFRSESRNGFGNVNPKDLPVKVRIVHQGSGQEYVFPLQWRGNQSALTQFAIPQQAKLGTYEVYLESTPPTEKRPEYEEWGLPSGTYLTGSFRVEEFVLPTMTGQITQSAGLLVQPKQIPLQLQLNYLNGGAAAGRPVEVSAVLSGRTLQYRQFEDFQFGRWSDGEDRVVVANKQAVSLDKAGAGKTLVNPVPEVTSPKLLQAEMNYTDPNGEIQTISQAFPVWPAAVVLGIKTEGWISLRDKARIRLVALTPDGKPAPGTKVSVKGRQELTISHRKKIVGGFYAYENQDESKDLGELCSGKADERGYFLCEVDLKVSGNINLEAQALDKDGKAFLTQSSIWVSGAENWFDGENQDRIDILPERKHYQPGETAKFQVRMPFRAATALVAVEREGIIETFTVEISGKDPSISVPIKAEYGPNVYVSVLAVRGRMREVPWYSFFTWGWKEPVNWWHEFREYQAPTATVDLAKPAFKYGVAEIFVSHQGNEMKIGVQTDQASYAVRGKARVKIDAKLADGKPAAGAELAIAVVDEALLELQPNESWKLLSAMYQRRSYGVETATAQMQVIGKRHFGRKAVAAGGGGGKSPTRELIDTLLLWKPDVVLDANGHAEIEVPINDALTSFRVVAIGTHGSNVFGTGSTSFIVKQDLQIITGLPPIVREGDTYTAQLTLRNTTTRDMQLSVTAKNDQENLPEQRVKVAAGAAAEVSWQLTVPAIKGNAESDMLQWEFAAKETGSASHASDSLKFSQKRVTAVPVTVQQATLVQIDKTLSMNLIRPQDALPERGGIALNYSASLLNGSEGLRRYFERYPYSCLEQRTSKAIGLRDKQMWQKVVNDLPSYLDENGLAFYFPLQSGAQQGSDALTAYLLAITQEGGYPIPDEFRKKMLQGLSDFVEGKITRKYWSPSADLDFRKLSALEALSRYQAVQPRMLGSISVTPNLWPTSAVLDWYAILSRSAAIPKRDQLLKEADQILRARLSYQGTKMIFNTEQNDNLWWLMSNSNSNAVRLLLTMADKPEWKEDMPRLLNGALQRQNSGHWGTTTANAWGTLALEKFARTFETEKVSGVTTAALPAMDKPLAFSWTANEGKVMLPAAQLRAGEQVLQLNHEGKGKPWVTLQSLAAIPLKNPNFSGLRLTRKIIPVEQKTPGQYSKGDVLRIDVQIETNAELVWVVLNDPVPAGASIMGSGLGRDSAIAANQVSDNKDAPVYEERSFDAYRAYYQWLPKGKITASYVIRLNQPGDFRLPSTRAEVMYSPEIFAELPNASMIVK